MFKIIVAHDQNRLIGNGTKIPWYISEDFQHFKKTTLNHTLIMGSVTFTSIGKPLSNRTTIILNYNKDFDSMGCEVSTSIEELITRFYHSDEVVYICGGASIYRQFMPYVDEMIISVVKDKFEGNIYFPEYETNFELISKEERAQFDICVYRRKV